MSCTQISKTFRSYRTAQRGLWRQSGLQLTQRIKGDEMTCTKTVTPVSSSFVLSSMCDDFRTLFESINAYLNQPVSLAVEKMLSTRFGTINYWLSKQNACPDLWRLPFPSLLHRSPLFTVSMTFTLFNALFGMNTHT